MARTIGRRTIFFALTGLVCVLLVPLTPAEFRWVDWLGAGLAAFWALALALEDLSRPGPPVVPPAESTVVPPPPFAPPPPPGGGGD